MGALPSQQSTITYNMTLRAIRPEQTVSRLVESFLITKCTKVLPGLCGYVK